MNVDQLDDDQLDQLATKLAPRFPTGSHGDRVVLTKRQFMGAATGVLSAGALMALGVDEASAQAAGSQGTPESPNNMYAYDLNVANGVTSSLPMGGNDIENAGSVSAGIVNNKDGIGGVEIESYEVFANSSTVLLPDFPNPTGIVTISETTTETAASFAIAADDITEIADEPGRFGISQGVESFNVFDNGSEFVVENTTGTTRTFCIIALITAE